MSKLRGWVTPTDAFLALFQNQENSFWLDREFSKENRFSVIGSGTPVTVDSIDDTRKYLESYPDLDLPFEFRPGLVGWFDFELAAPKFLRVESALVFDHENQQLFFIAKTDSDEKFKHWLDAALLRIGLIGGEKLKFLQRATQPQISKVEFAHNDHEYLELIRRAKAHIERGDVYQLCLTNQIKIQGTADPIVVFLKLREGNPSPYSSFIKIGTSCLVSSSPEQFLKVDSHRSVSTKPIKGTRPRSKDHYEDLAIARELANDEKERAENLMIVDLMRNDLARVCEPDSVSVPSLFEVESYETVHQLVSTVTGQLANQKDAISAIEAAFPGGSMTGAPKIKAVELIGELEGIPRGVYSGVFGCISDNGTADFGMAIRSIVFEGEEISIGVGGGITIDSLPEAELGETKLKAKAPLAALLVTL